ncbi:hypothetical protein V502_10836 [Pseudogymnoascus sp. VKM F-4520 (FW-2644)]|nr:hypothetical protein V502_10836 [Pseudogymnoascus sp. VKM F-4520 (FW-2644)]
MATEIEPQVTQSLKIHSKHPLQNITASEIVQASEIALRYLREQEKLNPSTNVRFKNISLNEPPKALLLPYLEAEAAGVPEHQRPYIPRCIELVYAFYNEQEFGQMVVNLDTNTEVHYNPAMKGQHSSMDRDELRAVAPKILGHPDVVKAIELLRLPKDTIVQVDTWMFGADKDSNLGSHKYVQGFMYARAPYNHPESNHYSFPLPFSPVYDVFEDTLVRIDPLATGGIEDGLAYGTASDTPMAHCVSNEYLPELQEALRKDVKPLHIVQPEGPSFRVENENKNFWQKWSFRLGFNYREGLTLHDIRYDQRPIFYRLSMSEMTVPYGDPRSPYHRKQAFDLGDAGAGSTANNLSLGCDCLGSIRYFSGWLNNEKGQPIEAPNVICMHEQDSGIGWKHTNHRTGVAANGTIDFETRATGILSTTLIDPGKRSYWGNVVSPGVLATNHQHIFCLRVDPMIDGANNTIIQEDSVPVLDCEEENPHGNAWTIVKTPFERSGFADAAPQANRVFKIVNENKINSVSGNPVGYKLVPLPSQLLLASEKSVVRKRARFAEHHIWVTKYKDGDLWAGGKWTNQSLSEIDGVRDYAARNENVRDDDLVLWHTFGLTHNPRVEDFPVMPCEVITVSLKPADFFQKNPAIDVPPSVQEINKSVLLTEETEVRIPVLDNGRCCKGPTPESKL